MSVVIGTLCLNEMQWLPKLYEQHKDWPGLERWVFVETADRVYAETNPDLVSDEFLSVDGTSEFLAILAENDSRVEYIPMGLSTHPRADQGKCPGRHRYMESAGEVGPDYVVAMDADEFYTLGHQKQIDDIMRSLREDALVIGYHNIWHPTSLRDVDLFECEIVGRFWHIKVCKLWKWFPGMCYRGNHNTPWHDGVYSNKSMKTMYGDSDPVFVHMGFASDPRYRLAKNDYYAARGEVSQPWKLLSRGAFERWKPGDPLPGNDRVVTYQGPIPEVFR